MVLVAVALTAAACGESSEPEAAAPATTTAATTTAATTTAATTTAATTTAATTTAATTTAAPPTSTEAAPKPPPPPTLAERIEASINDHLGDDDTDYGKPRAAKAECSGGYCMASYNADTPVFDVEGELIDAQRPIFKDAFAIGSLKELTITTRGQVTTRGGKELVDDVMEITCDRAANAQINWDRVDAGGVKDICVYAALVKL